MSKYRYQYTCKIVFRPVNEKEQKLEITVELRQHHDREHPTFGIAFARGNPTFGHVGDQNSAYEFLMDMSTWGPIENNDLREELEAAIKATSCVLDDGFHSAAKALVYLANKVMDPKTNPADPNKSPEPYLIVDEEAGILRYRRFEYHTYPFIPERVTLTCDATEEPKASTTPATQQNDSGNTTMANTTEYTTREAVLERVSQIIVEHLGVSETTVTPSADLINDLGADSLDMVEMVMDYEEAFDVEIQENEYESVNTVNDIVNLICTKLDIA